MSNNADVAMHELQCGGLHLLAPVTKPKYIIGPSGYLWQWVGDGETLLAATLTLRTDSRLTDQFGVTARATRELAEVRTDFVAQRDRNGELPVVDDAEPVEVSGSAAAAGGAVTGVQLQRPVHVRVVTTTDGCDLYTLQIVTRDTADGRNLAREVASSVRF